MSEQHQRAQSKLVTHLECGLTSEVHEVGKVHNLSKAGKPLIVRYDLDALKNAVTKDEIERRTGGFWKYREFLPIPDEDAVVSLGEELTPIVDCPTLMADYGGKGKLLVKDEGRLPTGSFKARGLALAVAMANVFGKKTLAMPTNGNAGAALAAYGSRVGMETICFCPADTPKVNIQEMALQGATVHLVDGFITDCGRIVGENKDREGWFDVSTLKEPYRIEGKKTMGLELAEQLGWRVPDVIFYPTGGGTGLIGMWKAFAELEAIGWIGSKRPKMVAVQATGCAPIVRAYEAGERFAEPWVDAATVAAGIRVPGAVGDFLILDAVRESGGFAIAVDDEAIRSARYDCGTREGLLLCPEGAATLAAYKTALANGMIEASDEAVLFNCGSGLKYPMPDAGTDWVE